MAYVLDNTTLPNAVQFYLQRSDPSLIQYIPLFMMLAQRRIADDMQVTGLKVTIGGKPSDKLIPGNAYFPKDNAWLLTDTFSIGTGANFSTYVQLFPATFAFCQAFNPDPTVTGQPVYFCTTQDQNQYYFSPTPDQAYPFNSVAFYTPPLIDATQESNFITRGMPRLLMAATMAEAERAVQQDLRTPSWEQMYKDEKTDLSQLELQRIYGFNQQPAGVAHVH